MAILEIAKIQIRRGQENVTGEPTLSPGEFGWAEDTEHLWIGKSISEGALDNKNTRILTENDLKSFASSSSSSTLATSQLYIGNIPGYSIPANTFPGSTSTTVQKKLDLFVSVVDFGAKNDLSGDMGALIQDAIDNLWLNSSSTGSLKESVRVALRIPAGVYNIANSLYLPPYATLIGEGKGKTVLNFTGTGAGTNPLVRFVGASSPPSHDLFNPSGPSAIVSSSQPQYINLSGITFKYSTTTSLTSTTPLIYADCSIDSTIEDCEFVGSYNAGTGASSNLYYTGIEIRGGNGSSPARNLTIDNCVFKNMYYGVRSTFDIENTVIQNSTFSNLSRGVAFSETVASVASIGPVRSRVENCKFTDIEREGFYVGNPKITTATNHVSAFNVYKNVGNNLQGDTKPITPVVTFVAPTNISIGDTFSRYNTLNSVSYTVTATVNSWMVSGPTSINDGVVYSSTVTTSATLAKIPFNGSEQTVRVDYNLLKAASNIARKGQLFINASILGGTPTANVTDSYSYTGANDGNLNFSASLNTVTNSVVLGYTSSDSIGTITYKYSLLQ